MPLPEETCVITVTYGARHRYVAELVDAATQNGVGHIVLVENGCEDSSRRALQRLSQQSGDRKISVVSLKENRGSATGFATGLQYAFERTDFPYVWCLDDDNIPESNALRSLLDAERQLRVTQHGPICLVSLRVDQPWLWRVAHGESASKVFLRRSSFCGFHVADMVRVAWTKFFRTGRLADHLRDQPIPLRFCPYGGLWMPTRLLGDVGYPDKRLVTYHDDTEYTSRLVQRGAQLFLVPDSRVRDAEPSWAQAKHFGNGFTRMLLSDEERRIFYNTRNKVYFEVYCRENSKLLQTINEFGFWILLYVLSLRYDVPERRRMIRRAVLDGKRASLGQTAFPLTRS